MSKAVFVGVDVSMDKLDISITLDGSTYDTMSIFNNSQSILGFFDYLQNTYKKSDFYFGYEPHSKHFRSLMFVTLKATSKNALKSSLSIIIFFVFLLKNVF